MDILGLTKKVETGKAFGGKRSVSDLSKKVGVKEEFLDMISCELMSNPVTVSSGQTYEKSQIVNWCGVKGSHDPVTGEIIFIDTQQGFKTNVVLKKCIEDYLVELRREELGASKELRGLVYVWICKRGRASLAVDPQLKKIVEVYDSSC